MALSAFFVFVKNAAWGIAKTGAARAILALPAKRRAPANRLRRPMLCMLEAVIEDMVMYAKSVSIRDGYVLKSEELQKMASKLSIRVL